MSQKLHEALMKAELTPTDEDILLDAAHLIPPGTVGPGAAYNVCFTYLFNKGLLKGNGDPTQAGLELAHAIKARRDAGTEPASPGA